MQMRVAAVIVLSAAALLVGCDKRAPRDVLFGTWQETFPVCIDCVRWITFRPDATVVSFTSGLGTEHIDYEGRWYAGGEYIYIGAEGRTQIWQIVEIQPQRMRLRHANEDYEFERVQREPPKASNQGDAADREQVCDLRFPCLPSSSYAAWHAQRARGS